MRNKQLIRQWQLLSFLSRHPNGVRVADISDFNNTPNRTVYRDLNALEEAGFPIFPTMSGKTSSWKLSEDNIFSSCTLLTDMEIIAFVMFSHFSSEIICSLHSNAMNTLHEKITSNLPANKVTILQELISHLHETYPLKQNHLPQRKIDKLDLFMKIILKKLSKVNSVHGDDN